MSNVRIDLAARNAATTARLKGLQQPVDEYHFFEFQKFHITDTRAVRNDTDTVSLALKVGDAPARVLIKHLGDVNNGTTWSS